MAFADAQTYLKVKDFTVENTVGIPDTVGWVRISGLGVRFDPHMASSTESRCEGEQHKIYDYAQGVWNEVTFECHGKADDTKAMWDLFDKFRQGDNLRGSITVNFINPKDAYGTIFSFELQELTVLNYSPGIAADAQNPGTLTFSFTVSPGYVKISG